MKKVLIILAIAAIASVAQAELLATWSFPAGAGGDVTVSTLAANIGQVSFGSLTRVGLNNPSTTTAGQFQSNGWDDGGSIQFTVAVNSGYQITGAQLVTAVNGSNTGTRDNQWQLNGTDVGAAVQRTSSALASWTANIGTITGTANTLAMVAGSTLNVTGGAIGSAGNVRLQTSLVMNGDIEVTPIPEPATMSLLGLGVLALAIRRRMK